MAEGEVLKNPILVGLVDDLRGAQSTAALGIFGLKQVALAGTGAHYFAGASDLEPFCHRFLCLNTFRASHIALHFLSKEREI